MGIKLLLLPALPEDVKEYPKKYRNFHKLPSTELADLIDRALIRMEPFQERVEFRMHFYSIQYSHVESLHEELFVLSKISFTWYKVMLWMLLFFLLVLSFHLIHTHYNFSEAQVFAASGYIPLGENAKYAHV